MKIIYQCEICGNKFDNPTQAHKCEAKPMNDFNGKYSTDGKFYIPKVGEIVQCSYPASSWYDGDLKWASWEDRGGRFLTGYYALWVLVAKIPDGDRHQWRYILWTPSNCVGNEYMCWTGPTHTRIHPHGQASEEQLLSAQKAYDAELYKHRIPLL